MIPKLYCIRRDRLVVEAFDQHDDAIDLAKVQLEVVEADGVQFRCRRDGVSFVIKWRKFDVRVDLF